MVDLKKLDLRYHLRMGDLPDDIADEIYRLVELGIWARKYRATIKDAFEDSLDAHGEMDDQGASAKEALATLPKEKEE